jgi:capsule synthesis protein PGA_cap
MRLHHAERRGRVRRRRLLAVALVALVAVLAGVAGARALGGGNDAGAAPTTHPSGPASHPASGGSSSDANGGSTTVQTPPTHITISAVGDTMLGSAGSLAPNPSSYFDAMRPAISADAAFANLEGTLTDQTSGKCATLTSACYEFRVPPSWARYFKHAGFTVMGNENNHAFDFWQAGLDDTVRALDRAGLAHTGRTSEITYVDVKGVRTAWLGFGPYPNNGPLNDSTKARAMIRRAAARADVVIVAIHAGAEGESAEHLTGQDEIYYGENRGNPEAFARMAVDAGADLILGSGPHVLRGMEFRKGRLIAYSLGDFAGYHNFTTGGALGVSAVLRVTLDQNGRFVGGRLVPVRLVGPGQPEPDSSGAGISLIRQLSQEDLGAHAARISSSGRIQAP